MVLSLIIFLSRGEKEESYVKLLLNYLHESKFSSINFFEIEDKPFEKIVFQELENSKNKTYSS